MQTKRKSVTKTFRIDDDINSAIQEEAMQSSTTLSSIVNKHLRRYIEFERYTEKFDETIVSTNFLQKIINSINEDSLVQIAKNLGEEYLEAEMEFFKTNKFHNPIENLIEWFKFASKYKRIYKCSFDTDRLVKKIILHHRLGKNWSLFLGHFYGTYLTKYEIKYEIEPSESTLIINLEGK